MNSTFARTLARALPTVGRHCQPRASSLRQMRAFSTPKTFQQPQQDGPVGLEQEVLGVQPDESAEGKSPASTILGAGRSAVSEDYTKMAEELEADILHRPSGERSPAHHLHIFSHRRNTILTLTRPNGSPLMSMGTGMLGYRKARRGGYDPGFQLTAHFLGQIQERGLLLDIKALEVVFRGFHHGRQAFVKALLGNEGKNIRGLVTQVSDATRIKFGGTRSPRVRRL